MNKYLIVLNPVSGSGRGKKSFAEINSFFSSRNLDYKIVVSEFHGHITKIIQENINNYDILIAAGGDGTVNEAVNGMDLESNKIFGVLPIGSGNDFAMNLNLPKKINDILNIITSPNRKYLQTDLLSVEFCENNNWFKKISINAVGIGFDAFVAYKNQHDKKFSGIISYIFAVFGALKDLKPLKMNLFVDDKKITDKFIVSTIGNGKTSGGGFYLNPTAVINDSKLNLTTIKEVKKLKLLKELPKALINKMDKVKEAEFYVGNKIRIELEEPYFVHSDGEILGTQISELNIEISEYKLNIISG